MAPSEKEKEIICLDDNGDDRDTDLIETDGIIPSTPMQPTKAISKANVAIATVEDQSDFHDVDIIPMTPENAPQPQAENTANPRIDLTFQDPFYSPPSSVVTDDNSGVSFRSKLIRSMDVSPSSKFSQPSIDYIIALSEDDDDELQGGGEMYTQIPSGIQGQESNLYTSEEEKEMEVNEAVCLRRRGRADSFVLLDDDGDGIEATGVGFVDHSTLAPGEEGAAAWDRKVIDLLDDSDIEEIVCLGARRKDKDKKNGKRKANSIGESKSSTKPSIRNLPMAHPWERMVSHQLGSFLLAANKTVEIRDGSFLRITDIFQDMISKEVRLRGFRLQRLRDMNGLLEKKINEVALFLEVDLDDSRQPEEQATIEISLCEIVRIRNLRFTNHGFPQCRNVSPGVFHNMDGMFHEGGLTARWKFTTTYASQQGRYDNIWKEKMLTRFRPEDCGKQFVITDSDLRSNWRGETIRGGSFKPGSQSEDFETVQQIFSIESAPEPEVDQPNLACPGPFEQLTPELNTDMPNATTKRRRSSLDNRFAVKSEHTSKRMCPQETEIEMTRRRVSEIEIDVKQHKTDPLVIDLTDAKTPLNDCPALPAVIDLCDSDISIPPESGYVLADKCSLRTTIARSAGQRLTYGDAFCGAGGATRGAVMAGLEVKWGFDSSEHACASWRENFPSTKCYEMHSSDFVAVANQATTRGMPYLMKVDILHISPPCQYFSPAHTVNGPMDDHNIASLFAVMEVIRVAKPRVVTLEQTFGLACVRFRHFFQSLVQMFTTHNFSVRWAVIPLAQWGLPQRRHRLIMIGSCPGETLPRIPAPTHSESGVGGLQPFISVNSILKSIPSNAPDHDIESVQFGLHRQMRPWDGNKILPRAMTTSGGQNYHPSGMRDLTLREYAALQGFPMVHVFKGSYVKKQIGNAVPPFCAKVLFESIKKDLDTADGIVEDGLLIE